MSELSRMPNSHRQRSSNFEFIKAWFALNFAVIGAILVTNFVVTNVTGRPLNFTFPNFTSIASASEPIPSHKRNTDYRN